MFFDAVRHAHHFVRNHLPDRQDQIVAAIAQQLVHLRRPRVVELALAHLAHELAAAPRPASRCRCASRARGTDRAASSRTSSQSRRPSSPCACPAPAAHPSACSPKNSHAISVSIPGLRVHPRKVRRHRQHPSPLTQPPERLEQVSLHLINRHLGRRRSRSEVQTHKGAS